MSEKSNYKDKTFREIMEEFEHVTSQFDAIELDIEQALELHKKASALLDELESRLKTVTATVKTTTT